MDIFAHALYTNAIYKSAQKRKRTWREIVEIVFWGDFPDLVTFAIFGVYWYFKNSLVYVPGSEYLVPPYLEFLLPTLYSIPLFLLIFSVLWLIRGKPYWPVGGWGIHIVIDVFTHSGFYPPQFLWPFSDYHFSGIAWDTPWFWFVTYTLLVIVYSYWYFEIRKQERDAK
ncbi:MAG: hypothetical protein KGJ13_00765 [Patescibacteria group bacterium]|nr:hypothetical protein [Patescibacteria group bacterium]